MKKYLALIFLLTTACTAEENSFSMDGKWSWENVYYCKDNTNSFLIEGTNMTTWLGGIEAFQTTDLQISTAEDNIISLSYSTDDGNFTDHYSIINNEQLRYINSDVLEDTPTLEIVSATEGRNIFRCP